MKFLKDAFPFVMFPLIVLLFEVAACQPHYHDQQPPPVWKAKWEDVTPPREDLQCWSDNFSHPSRVIVCAPKDTSLSK